MDERAFDLGVELCSYGTTVTQAIDLHLILGLGIGTFYEQPYPVEPWAFGTTTPILVEDGIVAHPGHPTYWSVGSKHPAVGGSLEPMGSAKRQRQKANREAKREAAQPIPEPSRN